MTPEEIEQCFATNEAELLREVSTKAWNTKAEFQKLELSARLAELAQAIAADALRGSVRSPETKGK